MAGFLYFLPGVQTGSLAAARAAGIGYAFGPSVTSVGVTRGPDGSPGCVVADAQRVPTVGYHPDRQKWRIVPGSAAWVGYCHLDKEPLPGPEDLIRPPEDLVRGHPVLLGDGRRWIVPIVRGVVEEDGQPIGYCALPRSIDWDDAGKRIDGGVLPAYEALWNAAAKWFDLRCSLDVEERKKLLEETWAGESALLGLTTNYAIGKAEAGILHLLNDRNEFDVLNAMIDEPGRCAIKKKEGPAGSSTSDGPPAATPATDPPSPTFGP